MQDTLRTPITHIGQDGTHADDCDCQACYDADDEIGQHARDDREREKEAYAAELEAYAAAADATGRE